MSKVVKTRVDLAAVAQTMYGRTELSKPEIIKMLDEVGAVQKPGFIWKNKTETRGYFDVAGPNTDRNGSHTCISHTGWTFSKLMNNTTSESDEPAKAEHFTTYVPRVNPNYVKDANFRTYTKVMESRQFFTVWTTGESGIGKTLGIEQAAAELGREVVRVNLTEETTERHLIGSLSLTVEDGASRTDWQDGPVLIAMKRGSLLLLDECDLASTKVLCLQSILEGNPYVNPHTGEVVTPKEGFNIFGTANTTGQMEARTAKFIGARPMNEAFLDRWSIMVRHTAPNSLRVLEQYAENVVENYSENLEAQYLVEDLAKWVDQTRESYTSNELETFITTRRVVGIITTWLIFNNIEKSVQLCLNRFDENQYDALMAFWKVISSDRADKIARNERIVESDNPSVAGSLDEEEAALNDFLNEL